MRGNTAQRILNIQERFRECRGYKELMDEYCRCDERLTALLSRLREEDQNIILDYLCIGVDIHMQMLELACETNNCP